MLSHFAQKLSTAAISGMGARSSNIVTRIGSKVATTALEMAEVGKEIKELIGNFCDDLRIKIEEIEKTAIMKLPEFIHQYIHNNYLDKRDVNAIIEILKMNLWKEVEKTATQINLPRKTLINFIQQMIAV